MQNGTEITGKTPGKTPVRCEQSGRMAPTWTTVGERERCPQCLNRAAIRNDGRWARHNCPTER
jgi:hypothetical protein